MLLQSLWSLISSHPAQALNALALFFSLTGGWLLIATRVREQRALARLADVGGLDAELPAADAGMQRLNLFFYRFGGATLTLALVLSWLSTSL